RRGLAKEVPVAVAVMESSGALQDNRRIIFHFLFCLVLPTELSGYSQIFKCSCPFGPMDKQ
ncbi:MAG TPA: hypothetical protein DCZ80_07470, partial [Legionellales bacterium]|nr:hypothetical protein [Legionellales bacterium]